MHFWTEAREGQCSSWRDLATKSSRSISLKLGSAASVNWHRSPCWLSSKPSLTVLRHDTSRRHDCAEAFRSPRPQSMSVLSNRPSAMPLLWLTSTDQRIKRSPGAGCASRCAPFPAWSLELVPP
ncbi:hypothetical protein HaLaN_00791 [Haematococcus lacustris]|uniref:Uncharacterized protein n=1 Tax=Haematococcus lacustris TaxID=44745 RepID=A0A699YA33_HAELA|nr:hypothetical protein HaLaN_00791 [Haematococcus lacustris]